MIVRDFFCTVYIFPSKEYLINNVGWMDEANIQKCQKCRLVVHVINFDPLVRPRSPTSWRSRGSRPLDLSLLTLPTLHRKRTALYVSYVVYFLTPPSPCALFLCKLDKMHLNMAT